MGQEDQKALKPDIREYLTEQSIIAYREYVIEECARVAESYNTWRKDYSVDPLIELVAAIRALKEKS